ncbi:integrase [Desulfobaculum xiamenense]|uniref:Integrase n=1 Tax=Desulfobaculum xiamenense TaxID=995050 RepID=A0A846QCH7_9BACT|nr:tyrosine-type recombinase/integrase [Desulfobaculum xiamenense]NJB66416.1 integrase [Desulfobaculum xiamenense]
MRSKRIPTGIPGICYREHAERRHGRYADRYYILRYRSAGRVVEEGVGWASEGATLEYCQELMAKIRRNLRTGDGPQSLALMREESARRRDAERAEREQREFAARVAAVTFDDVSARYLEWAKRNKRTWRDDERTLRLHVCPELGRLRMSDVTSARVNALKGVLEDKAPQRGRAERLAPATILNVIALVREVFNFATATPYDCDHPELRLFSGENPAAFNRFSVGVSLPRVDNRTLRVLFEDEFQRLQSASMAYSIDQYDAQAIAWHTGMRREEILSLRREHVSLLGRSFKVLDTKTGANRVVDWSDELAPVVERRLEMPGDWLFPGRDGSYRNPDSITRGFARVAERVGLNEGIADKRLFVTFKTLRASFAVRMLAAGMDLRNLQLQMGHADITTTSRCYLPLVESFKREAVARAAQRAKILDFKAAR